MVFVPLSRVSFFIHCRIATSGKISNFLSSYRGFFFYCRLEHLQPFRVFFVPIPGFFICILITIRMEINCFRPLIRGFFIYSNAYTYTHCELFSSPLFYGGGICLRRAVLVFVPLSGDYFITEGAKHEQRRNVFVPLLRFLFLSYYSSAIVQFEMFSSP